MTIDNCRASFSELANKMMPLRMEILRERMKNPVPMKLFGTFGKGKTAILKNLGLPQDFKGCYVLIDQDMPIYVGISQTVIQRLLQHVKGKTHNAASLAYRMAADEVPHKNTRNVAMTTGAFQDAFTKSKNYLRSLSVAFVEIENPVELYLFELYCAMELDTRWNTFKTH